MTSVELLRVVYQWLPTAFALDLLVFHFIGDHPLAMHWWLKRPGSQTKQALGLV